MFSVRNGASDKTPIALLARGSVQSGFNEVARRALGVVRVARPHRSLQIREAPQPDSFRSDISKPSDFFSKLLVEMSRRIGAIEAGQGGRWSRDSISHDYHGGDRP